MHFRALRLLMALFVFTLMPVFTPSSPAEYRGNFFGSYQISKVEESGGQVQLTITIVLQNYSGRSVANGGVIVYDSEPVRAALGAFSGIGSFPAKGTVRLSQEFTVSAKQYASWKQGEKPVMQMLVPEAGGSSRLERIDLAPAVPVAAPAE